MKYTITATASNGYNSPVSLVASTPVTKEAPFYGNLPSLQPMGAP